MEPLAEPVRPINVALEMNNKITKPTLGPKDEQNHWTSVSV
jgi:hypothetical protein